MGIAVDHVTSTSEGLVAGNTAIARIYISQLASRARGLAVGRAEETYE